MQSSTNTLQNELLPEFQPGQENEFKPTGHDGLGEFPFYDNKISNSHSLLPNDLWMNASHQQTSTQALHLDDPWKVWSNIPHPNDGYGYMNYSQGTKLQQEETKPLFDYTENICLAELEERQKIAPEFNQFLDL